MTRLFKDNGCETMTLEGETFSAYVVPVIRTLIQTALNNGLSLRDVQTMITEEAAVTCAVERLRRGLNERRQQRVGVLHLPSNR